MLAASLAACSPVYVYKAWRGQSRLMASRRPIAEVRADPAASPALRSALELVEAIRAFSSGAMAMPPSRSYSDFVDVGRPYVTVAVTAADKTALRPREWWFPVVGRVPYKGFFADKDARAEEARLEARGLDAYRFPVKAYSTLGWWRDPVLSTMIEESPGALAETLLHEMAHGALYLRGQGDFNESMATYAGERGAEEFLAARFGAASRELASYKEERAREEAAGERMESLCRDLEALYASGATQAEKLSRREGLFARAREDLDRVAGRPGAWPPLNNAVVLAHRRYRRDLEGFRALHDRLGGDWGRFWAALRALDRRSPWDSLRRAA